MNQNQIESLSNKNSCKKMNVETFCNWFALCNALKFINGNCELSGKNIHENDLNYKSIIHYVESVGGDILTCVKTKKAIPFKYSLNNSKLDDLEITDISYEFLDK